MNAVTNTRIALVVFLISSLKAVCRAKSEKRRIREPSGVLDTERPGTKFEDWEGHKLDRPLLALLQKKRKA